jgi:hypothetical protein
MAGLLVLGDFQMAAEPPYPKPVYAWYVVGVLTLVLLIFFH